MNIVTYNDVKEKVLMAQRLLSEETTTVDKFKAIRKLIHGINPKIDNLLDAINKEIETVQKLQEGQIIELTVESLPDRTEGERRRKKALLLFIQYWKQLQSEVDRVKNELKQPKQSSQTARVNSMARIIAYAKGPFGIITLGAVIIVGFIFLSTRKQATNNTVLPAPKSRASLTQSPKIKGIIFNGKKIPLKELLVGQGPDCTDPTAHIPHYHALNHTAVEASDGSIVSDPGGCGFGKVSEVVVVDISE